MEELSKRELRKEFRANRRDQRIALAVEAVEAANIITAIKPRNMRGGKCMYDVMGAFQAAKDTGRSASQFQVADTAAQRLVRMDRNGRLKRRIPHGSGSLITNFARGTSARPR